MSKGIREPALIGGIAFVAVLLSDALSPAVAEAAVAGIGIGLAVFVYRGRG